MDKAFKYIVTKRSLQSKAQIAKQAKEHGEVQSQQAEPRTDREGLIEARDGKQGTVSLLGKCSLFRRQKDPHQATKSN